MKRALACVLIVALAAAAGLWLRQNLISTIRIAGTSMETTLLSGDVVLVLRSDNSPAFGDLIECRFSGRSGSYVKRVVGLPGDTIEFRDNMLYRSGVPTSEPYVSSPTGDFSISVEDDCLFVLGDNRAESYDSRAEDMGCISADDVLGRAMWILWPLNRFGPIE